MRLRDRLRVPTRVVTALALGGALALSSTAAASAASPGSHPALSAAQRMIAAEATGSAHASQPAATAANSGSSHVCAAVITVGKQACLALKRDGVKAQAASVSPNAIPSGVGYGPSQLQSAYNLTSASAGDGSGRTIAIVDAYDDPTAAADLAAYRSAAGLPTVPSFKKVNQNGAASPLPAAAPSSDDWTLEESLDLDMASAICPLCNIVLVEANDDSSDGLYVANNAAAGLGRLHLQLLGRFRGVHRHLVRLHLLQPRGRHRHHGVRGRLGLRRDLPGDLAERGLGRRHGAEHRVELARLDRVGVEHHAPAPRAPARAARPMSRSRPGRPR